jgi:hypothetical protein
MAWWLLWNHFDINAVYLGGLFQMTSTRNNLNIKSINYCIPGIISMCSAGVNWVEHRVCKFALESSIADRCRFYIEATDGVCSCPAAKRDAMTIVEGYCSSWQEGWKGKYKPVVWWELNLIYSVVWFITGLPGRNPLLRFRLLIFEWQLLVVHFQTN